MPEFTYDVTGVATFHIDAEDEDEAQAILNSIKGENPDTEFTTTEGTAIMHEFSVVHDGAPQGADRLKVQTFEPVSIDGE